jgi:hypothetical protein
MAGPYVVVIPPNKPYAPTYLETVHGIKCWNEDGVQYADSPDAQELIDGYDPLPRQKAKLKAALDFHLKARSDAVAEDRKKFLYLGQFDDLLFQKEQLGELSVEQSRLQTALLGAWATIGDIQNAAARVAADIDALLDIEEALAFDSQAAFEARLIELGVTPLPRPPSTPGAPGAPQASSFFPRLAASRKST